MLLWGLKLMPLRCSRFTLSDQKHNDVPSDELQALRSHKSLQLIVQKPLICAVAGYAVAGGLELSLLADLPLLNKDAVFDVFCRRWGVPLIDGGTVRLQGFVSLGPATDMILTGRQVEAQEAFVMGLASRVVPKGEPLNQSLELARQLIALPCFMSQHRSEMKPTLLTELYLINLPWGAASHPEKHIKAPSNPAKSLADMGASKN
ncbi:hypothetical protein N7451_003139 [Penicillium sp. IBT 35674x]|nr:hypothetical protein N7451_003139 [Penicillium sp. IBT 35674x]